MLEHVLAPVLPLFGLIAAGYLSGRRRMLGEGATDALNRYVLFLALPAQLFLGLARITWAELDQGGFVATYGLGLFGTFAVALLLARRLPLADASIEALGAAYPNAGYMGIPLCLAVFGPSSLPATVLGTLLTVCALFAASIALVELDLGPRGADGARDRGRIARHVLGTLVRNPLLIAPVAGGMLAASGLTLPGPAVAFLGAFAGSTTPCALVAIGLFLADRQERAAPGPLARVLTLKLVLQPALTFCLAFAFGLPARPAATALLLSALPIGTGPFMLAKLYNREPGPMSRAILISTVLSLATVPAVLACLVRF